MTNTQKMLVAHGKLFFSKYQISMMKLDITSRVYLAAVFKKELAISSGDNKKSMQKKPR
jgi:hypothetical protein